MEEKDRRIHKEICRLKKILKPAEDGKKKVTEGLISRAAFMRVELEDLEDDLKENGWTETFQQSEKLEAYERARPAGQTYISLSDKYMKVMKQMLELLPEEGSADAAADLMAFVNGRK